MIDLDANATTRPEAAVVEAMLPFLSQGYGNPSSEHRLGRAARQALEEARGQAAALIGAELDEVVFTSGGTEAINAVHIFARQEWPERPVLVTTPVEHAAGIECAARWRRQGGEVRLAHVDVNGVVDLASLKTLLADGAVALVSVIWGNNEVGTVAPMQEITDLAHEAGALVHADAVQMAGKIPIHVREVPVDYLSLSAHKLHGPKGCGALYVNRGARFRPLLLGGGQENGRRSGTENLPAIAGFGRAAELARSHLEMGLTTVAQRRDLLEQLILEACPEAVVHARHAPRLPNTSSIAFPGVDAAGLLILLDEQGVAVSGGSACDSGQLHPSHVLEAMGYDARHAGSTVRFSLSRFTTEAEVRTAAAVVARAVERLKGIFGGESPVVVGGA
jgi:cysteine desulfurase